MKEHDNTAIFLAKHCVLLNISIFIIEIVVLWDVIPCSLVNGFQHCEGIFQFHFYGRRQFYSEDGSSGFL